MLWLVFLISCSQLKNHDLKEFISPEQIENLTCFSSEGKGRVESEFGKYVFNYESLLDKKNKKYQLVTQFPLFGEELISIDYQNDKSLENFKQTKFYQNLLAQAKKNKQESQALDLATIFAFGLSSYLNFLEDPKLKNCSTPVCELRLNEKMMFGKNDLVYWRQFATNLNLKITQTNLSDGKFKKQLIELLQSESKLLTMTLFVDECVAQ